MRNLIKAVMVIFFFIVMIISLFTDGSSAGSDEGYADIVDTEVYDDQKGSGIEHSITWSEPSGEYSIDFTAWYNAYEQSYEYRENDAITSANEKNLEKLRKRSSLAIDEYGAYWAFLYQDLLNNDTRHSKLTNLTAALDSVRDSQQMDYVTFANFVISTVQHWPYYLVHSDDCDTYMEIADENGWDNGSEYHPDECMPDIKYGVQSPGEYVYNLRGDCDTKALLLYALLNRYNYDVAFLMSNYYAHAMLGISIQANGEAKRHRGVDYYFVEATAPGWEIGQVPPEWNDPDYWDIILINQ